MKVKDTARKISECYKIPENDGDMADTKEWAAARRAVDVAIFKAGIREVVELALQAIKDEPEFPGDMPDELWIELNGDRHNTLLSMRNSVRLTKKGIIERLEAKLKEWNEAVSD